jgi:hypothetical protein
LHAGRECERNRREEFYRKDRILARWVFEGEDPLKITFLPGGGIVVVRGPDEFMDVRKDRDAIFSSRRRGSCTGSSITAKAALQEALRKPKRLGDILETSPAGSFDRRAPSRKPTVISSAGSGAI